MSFKEKALLFLLIMGAYGGHSLYKSYSQDRLEEKKVELEAARLDAQTKEKLALLDALNFAQQEDKDRDRIFIELAEKDKEIARLRDEARDHYKERLKFTSRTKSITVDNMEMMGVVAEELLKPPKPKAEEVRLDDVYYIEKTNHMPENYHTFTIMSLGTGRHITSAALSDLLASSDIGVAILDAARRKTAIGLRVNGTMVGGEITEAEILGIYDPQEQANTQGSPENRQD